MDSWSIVNQLGLAIKRPTYGVVVYGSADPLPNPAELLLTQLVAEHYRLGWKFFNYCHGKNLYTTVSEIWPNPQGVFNLESIIPLDLTLGKISEEIWKLRKEPVIVAHLSDGSTLRATSCPEKKWSKRRCQMTICDLHRFGGWLGGSAIHYLLRIWAEKEDDVLFICPFQEKGHVYHIYRGIKRKLFILTPFLKFVPPKRLMLPDWAPAPWEYWQNLPASLRKRVKKKAKALIFSGDRRIEINLL